MSHIVVVKDGAALQRAIQHSRLGETAGSLVVYFDPDHPDGKCLITFETDKGVAKIATTLQALCNLAIELTPSPKVGENRDPETGFIIEGADPVEAISALDEILEQANTKTEHPANDHAWIPSLDDDVKY